MATQKLRSVLYVDDDPDICAVVQAALRHIACVEVSTAASGAMAIKGACEQQPDLILMDVMMPGLDGPSTFQRLRENMATAHIPVIFLTAKVMPEEIGYLLRLGAIGVIAKPFDPVELCADLHKLWNGRGNMPDSSAHSSNGHARVRAQIDSLTEAYLQRAAGDVAGLQEMLLRARDGDRSAFGEAERASHSIHGAAAMFGFPEISALGGMIECLVQSLMIDGTAAGRQGEADRLEQLLLRAGQLAHKVEAAAGTVSGERMFQTSAGGT